MVNDLTIDQMQGRISQLESELRALHIVEAMEHLRADQGWQRYESANKQLRQLEAQLAAQPVGMPPYTHAMKMAGYDISCKYGVYEARAFDLADEMYSSMLAAAPAPAAGQEESDGAMYARVSAKAAPELTEQVLAMVDRAIPPIARRVVDCTLDGSPIYADQVRGPK